MDRVESYPAEEFSIHTGIEGLSQEWNISNDVLKGSHTTLKYYGSFLSDIFPKYNKRRIEKKTEQTYFLLIKDNEELKNIKAPTHIDKSNVVSGAISKFNFNDIKFFTENYDSIQEYNSRNKYKYELIKNKYGMYPEWVMSPETINLIKINTEYYG
jgi:hypothetical protein